MKCGEALIKFMGGTPSTQFASSLKRLDVVEGDVNNLKVGLVAFGAISGLAIANSIRASVVARKGGKVVTETIPPKPQAGPEPDTEEEEGGEEDE